MRNVFFTNLGYLVDKQPAFFWQEALPFLILFVLMLLTAIIVPLILRRRFKGVVPYQRLSSRLSSPLFLFGWIGLGLLFFRWQSLPYLSARILLVILICAFLTWLINFFIYLMKSFPQEVSAWQETLRRQRYLKRVRK